MIAGFFSQIRTKSAMKSHEVKQQWIEAKQSIVEDGLANELTVLLEALFQKKEDEHHNRVVNWKNVNIFLGYDYQLFRRFATADRLFYSFASGIPSTLKSCTDQVFDLQYISIDTKASLTIDGVTHKLYHDSYNLGRSGHGVSRWNPTGYLDLNLRVFGMESVIHMRTLRTLYDCLYLIPDLWFIVVEYCIVFDC